MSGEGICQHIFGILMREGPLSTLAIAMRLEASTVEVEMALDYMMRYGYVAYDEKAGLWRSEA